MNPEETIFIEMEMTFDAGHRIVGHKGKCARLHGHTYRVKISAWGKVKEPGFVVDFGDLKDLVNEWDHRMLLWDEDPFFQEFGPGGWGGHDGVVPVVMEVYGLLNVQFNPTAENMASYLAHEVIRRFGRTVDATQVIVWETPNASAMCTANSLTHDGEIL